MIVNFFYFHKQYTGSDRNPSGWSMTDVGQKQTIDVKGYRWGFTRSLHSTKQDKEQYTYAQTEGLKCRSGHVHF